MTEKSPLSLWNYTFKIPLSWWCAQAATESKASILKKWENVKATEIIVISKLYRRHIFPFWNFTNFLDDCIPCRVKRFTTSMTDSSSLLLHVINNYTWDKRLKGLETKADVTAMTTEHYSTGAAHYDIHFIILETLVSSWFQASWTREATQNWKLLPAWFWDCAEI